MCLLEQGVVITWIMTSSWLYHRLSLARNPLALSLVFVSPALIRTMHTVGAQHVSVD